MRAEAEPYRLNEKAAILVNHAIVALMMVCLAYTILQLAHRLVPGWQGFYLPLLMCLVSAEAMVTWRATRRWSDLNLYGLAYWAVEWVVLLVLIKLFIYAANGGWQLLSNLAGLLRDLSTNFLNTETIFVILVAFIVWLTSGLFARDLMELEGDEVLVRLSEPDRILIDRSQFRRSLVARVFSLGFVIILVTAILHLDFKTFNPDPFISRADLLNVVIYFLLGLVMFSQTHFSLLRTTWAWDRVSISAGITRGWTLFSLVFLAVISIIAFILPTSYSLGFLTTLNYVASMVGSVVYYLFILITIPILAVLNLLMSLFFKKTLQAQPVQPPVLPKFTPNTQPVSGMPWLDLVKSILFWAVLIGVVVYAFYQYFRQNQELLDRLSGIPVFSWLLRVLGSLRGLLRGVNQRVSIAVKNSLIRLRSRGIGGLGKSQTGFLRLRRLSPRQRIQFFYLALVRRGGEHGLPRQISQTPYEYAQVLESQVADVGDDLNAMTEAFLEARYSKHEITNQRANLVQRYWDRIKLALKAMRDGLKISP